MQPHLTADVTHNRNAGLGGSDAKRIIDGQWQKLWMEKTGRAQPDDLSDIFRVQLGSRTESFHAEWFGKVTGMTLVDPKPFYIHPTDEFMFAHLDRWVVDNDTFVELKHSSSTATCREKAQYYMPQMAHYAYVTGVRQCWFSVIPGNSDPDYALVEIADSYIERLVELERSFWWHVENDVMPELLPTAKIAGVFKFAETIKIGGFRKYDNQNNNHWATLAGECIALKPMAQRFDAASKQIKELVPDDAAEVYGHGITIKRDKAGRLRMYEKEA